MKTNNQSMCASALPITIIVALVAVPAILLGDTFRAQSPERQVAALRPHQGYLTPNIPNKINASDGTLNDGDFFVWLFDSFPGGSGTAAREDSGGNPGARLQISTSSPSGTGTVTAIKNDFVTNIPFEGDPFTFSIDFLSGPGAIGEGQALLLLVEQGSDIYVLPLGITGVQADWTTLMFTGTLNQADFSHLSGSGAAMPDFTSGIATKFGFAGQNSFSSVTNFYDNYQVVSAAIPTPSARLLNISTRMEVLTGENVLIGGFIVTGTDPKVVILRAIGPSLTDFGISGALADPVLELHEPGDIVVTNDNWKDTQQTEIEDTGIPPSNDNESALVATLTPGNYTAIVRGQNDGTGIGLVEVYDLNSTSNSQLANISTRGFVDTGDNVMIGGIIVGPVEATDGQVLVRAIDLR